MSADSPMDRGLTVRAAAATAQRPVPGPGDKTARRARRPGERGSAKPAGTARGRRRGWPSTLTRRILTLNVLVLLIPVLGLLHLDQYRQSLIASELDALRIQGRAFALSLGSTAVVSTRRGEERLLPEMARHLMRVLLVDTGVRARIFARSGELLADSFVLIGPGGQVQVMELPPPDDGSLLTWIDRLYDRAINWLPFVGELPEYREARIQRAGDYEEVERALAGESPGMVRADRAGRLALSVAVPVQRYRQVLGALMLSKDGAEIAAGVRDRRLDILLVFAVALAVTVLLSLYLAGTIARPVRRLAEAADLVRHGKGRQFEIPDFTHRRDELGDLSGALRDMTEALWGRLDAIEGFAADVAHEIKNPLTSLRSAVETVARVEDSEQQKKLMSVILDDVQRLDRLIGDISDASRLDAELSRAQTETIDAGRLLSALVEVHQATSSEDGPRFRLEIADHQNLLLQGIEGRLGQVLRNLISNAITFSPPGGTIGLAAWRDGAWVVITVSDEGPGIPMGKLAAVFERFYSERPRTEKFGIHSGLGLSISKQIVEAHGGTIRAENRMDDGDRVVGARFVIRLPAE
ncbi:MAG: stimulus-sensing domain-containing protein [Kiloniellaceae bacterium]